jgi:hypothetical protein
MCPRHDDDDDDDVVVVVVDDNDDDDEQHYYHHHHHPRRNNNNNNKYDKYCWWWVVEPCSLPSSLMRCLGGAWKKVARLAEERERRNGGREWEREIHTQHMHKLWEVVMKLSCIYTYKAI